MIRADPVWVNIEEDESSISSDRIRDQEMPDGDGASGMNDEQSIKEDPNADAADDVPAAESCSNTKEIHPAKDDSN